MDAKNKIWRQDFWRHFTFITSRRLYNAKEINKKTEGKTNQAAGTRKTKVSAKGENVENVEN